ncbi:MAG: exodeoxyribonuclease VII large subunit [Verrucomicrobiota bacterium]
MLDNLFTPEPEAVLQVSALTRQIKTLIEGSFSEVWVRGEVSNLRRQSSGHVYFSLKDAGSQLPCVLFARDAARQNFELEDGMELLLFGSLSLYEPHGRYQLIAKIALQDGQGKLQAEFERLKRKLAAEGLFEAERKQALPLLPRRVAVITSPTGAALQDFLRILKRRGYCGDLVIFPCRVQGRGAAEEIAAMLEYVSQSEGFDLAVITRGGGSIEDLWAFNEESLVRSVSKFSIPLISAVGHEIDTVLTDYAADQRAETPSGAAELISSLYLETCEQVQALSERAHYTVETAMQSTKQALRELHLRIQLVAPDRLLANLSMQLDDQENLLKNALNERLHLERANLAAQKQRLLEHHPRNRIQLIESRLDDQSKRLTRAASVSMEQLQSRIEQLRIRLDNNGIAATLKRGYTYLKAADGSIIAQSKDLETGQKITAQMHDGSLDLDVREVRSDDE